MNNLVCCIALPMLPQRGPTGRLEATAGMLTASHVDDITSTLEVQPSHPLLGYIRWLT